MSARVLLNLLNELGKIDRVLFEIRDFVYFLLLAGLGVGVGGGGMLVVTNCTGQVATPINSLIL